MIGLRPLGTNVDDSSQVFRKQTMIGASYEPLFSKYGLGEHLARLPWGVGSDILLRPTKKARISGNEES